jgi:hypothetical protein
MNFLTVAVEDGVSEFVSLYLGYALDSGNIKLSFACSDNYHIKLIINTQTSLIQTNWEQTLVQIGMDYGNASVFNQGSNRQDSIISNIRSNVIK